MRIPFYKSKAIKPATKRRITDSLLATIGYILSPLSWWNDMIVNIPLAYAFSFPLSLMSEKLFLPTFILGYWFSNLLGLMMLHRGVAGLVSKTVKKPTLRSHIVITFLYTAVIIIFVWLQWIPLPSDLIRLEK